MPPDRDSGMRGAGQQLVTFENIIEPFLEDHIHRFSETEQHVDGRRAGVFAVMFLQIAARPVPIGCAEVRGLVPFLGLGVGGDETQARGRHQTLL